jgi:hypothetical protein
VSEAGHNVATITGAGLPLTYTFHMYSVAYDFTTSMLFASSSYGSFTGIAKIYPNESSTGFTSNGELKLPPKWTERVVAGYGGATATTSADGTGTLATFYGSKMSISARDGMLYIVEANKARQMNILTSNVTTLAGNGVADTTYTNGAATGATFWSLTAVAADSFGSVYVADKSCIRKISNGTVSTFSGSCGAAAAYTDGTASLARFGVTIGGLAMTTDNVLYVSDLHCIRRVQTDGSVTTFAGLCGTNGYTEGNGTSSRFKTPLGLVVDNYNELFIADSGNSALRKITAGGIVSTIAGNGTQLLPAYNATIRPMNGVSTGAEFIAPTSVTIDATGRIFVCDYTQNIVKMVT